MLKEENLFLRMQEEATAVIRVRNQANALRSTGPNTPEGRTRSSANSLKHGLTAKAVVIPGEDPAEFDRLHDSLVAEHKPSGTLETEMVGEIAACLWRLGRAREREASALTNPMLFSNSARKAPGFDRLMRYMGSIERQLNRAITRLQQFQAERRKLERDAPPSPETQPQTKTMTASASAPIQCTESGFVLSQPETQAASLTQTSAIAASAAPDGQFGQNSPVLRS